MILGFLDEVSTGSGSDLVVLTDQVATAPCTDLIQAATQIGNRQLAIGNK